MTLLEIMIVLTLVAVATGGVVLSFRTVSRTQARAAASKLGSAIRYLYDQAVVSGKYYRLTIDFATNTYKAEKSDDRFYLTTEKENGPGGGKAFDADAETKALDEEDKRDLENAQGMARQLQPPPRPKRAHFQSFQDIMVPAVAMSGAYLRDVYTPRQREAYTEGKAYLYFFPDGHTERAVIHVAAGRRPAEDEPRIDEDRPVFTLIVHPLTGRVELKNGDVEVPGDFDQTDEEGQSERER